MLAASAVNEFTSAIYGTVGALVAGAGIQFLSKISNKSKDQLEEHIALRKELREELDSVKEELYALQKELDEWKQKYYLQVEVTNELKNEILKLTDEVNEYKRISGIHPINNGWFDVDEKN